MQVGLLWYDGDAQCLLEEKVGKAAQRYREKFGRWPNTCYVHPQTVSGDGDQKVRVAGSSRGVERTINILPAPNVLLHHYWVGESTQSNDDGCQKAAA
jgi:hypothetical protein